jgi:hypothetical protein
MDQVLFKGKIYSHKMEKLGVHGHLKIFLSITTGPEKLRFK